MVSFLGAILLGCLHGAYSSPVSTFEDNCSSLIDLSLTNISIRTVEFLSKGTNLTLPVQDASCGIAGGTDSTIIPTDLCRVWLDIATSPSSTVGVEVWMPRNWTGRFLSGGNGGLTGCYGYHDLSTGAATGFATVSGNNGHDGNTGEPFLNAPEVFADYAYRAIHLQTVTAKQIVQNFYNKQPSYSYFASCSGGGRQAMKSAQTFPEDFDGIISASPALDFPNFINWGSYLSATVGLDANATTFLKPGQWEAIINETARQCDGIDGAVDGILEDPELCQPDLSTIICGASAVNTSACISGAQADIVTNVFTDLHGLNGEFLYPRMSPGALEQAIPWYFTGENHQYTKDWFKYVVYSDPNFDDHTLTRQDYAVNTAQDPFGVSAFDGDLSAFRKHGAKLIHLHGTQDGLIPVAISTRYYRHVAQTMGLPTSEIDKFYRYFKVSGLAHCSGGTGAATVGLYGELPFEPESNVIARLVQWVEEGDAPDYIRGFKLEGGFGPGVEFQRKHCKHPSRNVYVGPGQATDENAWECQ